MEDLPAPYGYKEFRVGDLFDRMDVSYKGEGNGLEELRKEPSDTHTVPMSYAIYNNGGVGYWSKDGDFNTYNNCLVVVSNGAVSTGLVYPHSENIGVRGESYILKLKDGLYGKDEFWTYPYLSTVLEKLTYQKYSREQLSTWNRVIDDSIYLPVTSIIDEDIPLINTLDFDYMEQYIFNQAYIHLKNVDAYVTYEIDLMKQIIGEEYFNDAVSQQDLIDGLEPATEWKEFRLGDLFDVVNGGRVRRQDQLQGEIPYVTAQETNNGIENYISNPKFVLNDIITVSFMGKCFYHEYTVSIKDGTYGLVDKVGLDREHKLYIMTLIEKVYYNNKDYSNALRGTELENTILTLPLTPTGELDLTYMREVVMRGGGSAVYYEPSRYTSPAPYNSTEPFGYREFRVGNLFEYKSIKQVPRGFHPELYTGGNIPYITQSKDNNGIVDYINPNDELDLQEGKIILIGVDNISNGVCYWQEDSFYGNKISGLIDDELNGISAMYVITEMLKKWQEKHSYNAKLSKEKINDTYIDLPINEEGLVDYTYMEEYTILSSIKYVKNREYEHKQRLNLMESILN